MRIVYIGCRKAGYECLKKILKLGYNVVSVYTLDESLAHKTSGFKSFDDINISINKVLDINKHITAIQHDKPDLILQVGWSQIICDEILNIPRLGCYGFHASLLPDYAGGSPVNWGLINDEKLWGTTFFRLTSDLDNGFIIAQKEFWINDDDDCGTVYDKVTELNKLILQQHLPRIESGTSSGSKPKYQIPPLKRRKPSDGEIDWSKSAREIFNFVRAQTHPYPGAFTYLDGKKIHIWKVRFSVGNVTSYLYPNIVKCGDGKYLMIVDAIDENGIRCFEQTLFTEDRKRPKF